VTLRATIFRLLEERQRAGISEMPTVGQIASVLGVPPRQVFVTLMASEAMGQVWMPRGLNERDDEVSVMLKPAAFIYLESVMNAGGS
jgi:hypothetical protein